MTSFNSDGKLVQSADANRALTLQLDNIEPLVANFEALLEETKLHLKEEKRQRQQAEICQAEAEERCRELEAGNGLHLGGKDVQEELLDELEALTSQFIDTQRRLTETEDLLREETEKVRRLEVESSERNDFDGSSHAYMNDYDSAEDEEREPRCTEKDKRSVQVLERLLKDQNDEKVSSDDKLKQYAKELSDSKRANIALNEEVTCLREALDSAVKGEYHRDPDFQAKVREDAEKKEEEMRKGILKEVTDTVVKEIKAEKDRDINALREKFKALFKENAILQEKAKEGEEAMQQTEDLKELNSKLNEDVAVLTLSLEEEKKSHKLDVSGVESLWKHKFDQTVCDANKEKGENAKTLTATMDENQQMKKQLKVFEGNLQASRDEILRLKEIVSELNDSLEETNTELDDHRMLLEESKHEIECVNEELVESKQQLQDQSQVLRLSRDESTMLKKMVRSLNSVIEQSKDEKSVAFEQLEITREQLAKARRALQLSSGEDLSQGSNISIDLTGVGIIDGTHDLVAGTTLSSARSMDELLEENSSLERKLFESEETVSHLRGELKSTQSTVVSLRADLIEYEANEMLSKEGSLKQESKASSLMREDFELDGVQNVDLHRRVSSQAKHGNVMHLEKVMTPSFSEDLPLFARVLDNEKLADQDRITIVDDGLKSVPQCISEDASETGRLKLSLLVSRDEVIVLKRQVERLKAALDNSMTNRSQKLAGLRQEVESNLSAENQINADGQSKVPHLAIDKQDNASGILVATLVEENGALQEKLEGTEKALEELQERQRVKEEMMKSHDKESDSYELNLTMSAEEMKNMRTEIMTLRYQLKEAENKSLRITAAYHALQGALEDSHQKRPKDTEQTQTAEKMSVADQNTIKTGINVEVQNLKTSLASQRQKCIVKEQGCGFPAFTEENNTAQFDWFCSATGREAEFRLLCEHVDRVTEERSALQHQIDDAKIALNVSQYSQERNKEELRSCETQLELSRDEVFKLKKEIAKSNSALVSAKKEHSLILEEMKTLQKQLEGVITKPDLDAKDPNETSVLTEKVRLAESETCKLQYKIAGLEKALFASQRALQNKEEELDRSVSELRSKDGTLESLEKSLISSREETRMLTDEISHLSSALENAKSEYDAVVDELEAVNELFDEARQDAEKRGRAAAIKEIHHDVKLASERESKLLRDQLERALENNSMLQKKVDETETLLVIAQSAQQSSQESTLLQEICSLQDLLKSSTTEVAFLKEKVFTLGAKLTETEENLVLANDKFKSLPGAKSKDSTGSDTLTAETLVFPVASDALVVRLQQLFESDDKSSISMLSDQELELKELVSEARIELERIGKESCCAAEELGKQQSSSGSTIAAVKSCNQTEATCTKEVRTNIRLKRERQISEWRQEYEVISNDNVTLRQKNIDLNVAIALARETEGRYREKLDTLTEALRVSKAETRRIQEESSNLKMELESSTIHKSAHDEKVKALNHQLNGLSIENSMLQQKFDSAITTLQNTQKQQDQTTGSGSSLMPINLKTTENSLTSFGSALGGSDDDAVRARDKTASFDCQDACDDGTSAVTTSRDDDEANTIYLEQNLDYATCKEELKISRKEAINLKGEVSKLKQALQHANSDHVYLRSQIESMNDRIWELCTQAEERGRQEMRMLLNGNNTQELNTILSSERCELQGTLEEISECRVTPLEMKSTYDLATPMDLRVGSSMTTDLRGNLQNQLSRSDNEAAIEDVSMHHVKNMPESEEMRDDVDLRSPATKEQQRSRSSSPLMRNNQLTAISATLQRPVVPDGGVDVRRKLWKDALEAARKGRRDRKSHKFSHLLASARRMGHSRTGLLAKPVAGPMEESSDSIPDQSRED